MKNLAKCLATFCFAALPVHAVEVSVTYLRQIVPPPPVLSNLDPIPEDLGQAGAKVGLADNATTGQFLGQTYTLTVVDVTTDDDFAAAAKLALAQSPYIIVDAPAQQLLAAADLAEAADAILFNATAPDAALRGDECRPNVLHTLPSVSMRTDALMQFLQRKRWADLALIAGTRPADETFAEALKSSADKFGLRIRGEKAWAYDADMRRNAAQELPLFTQDLRDHDVLLVADETDDFARYIAFNTWDARPVAGSSGLTPVAWSRVVEQWGAAQLQKRFTEAADRSMQDEDYAAWAAMRALGEAVTRTGSAEPAILRDYLLGPDFELAGFKGRPLSFRPWNGQLRQPIPLVTPRALVAQAPLEGFLHPVTELDTLGQDQPETTCTAFN